MAGQSAQSTENQPISYLGDLPTVKDEFGTLHAGDFLARMTLEVEPPFTIAVNGKWGSGKTSVMRRALANLGGSPVTKVMPFGADLGETGDDWKKWSFSNRDSRVRRQRCGWTEGHDDIANMSACIWFCPWQHQDAPNPLVPLLLEIRAQVTSWLKRLQNSEINRRGGMAALALLGELADAAARLAPIPLPSAGAAMEKARRAWGRAEPVDLTDGQRFHLLFDEAVDMLLDDVQKRTEAQNASGRLIIFVDDLDRCEEETAIRLLESIKLYLGSRRCVFVLGMDVHALESALSRVWPERSMEENREYLAKLVQASVPVPVPDPECVRKYVEQRLKALGFPENYPTEGQKKRSSAALISELLEPVPRRIKNFVNSLCATWTMAGSVPPEEAGRFILFHYLRLFHPDVWRLLERQRWALQVLTAVLTKATSELEDITPPGESEPVSREDQAHLRHQVFVSP